MSAPLLVDRKEAAAMLGVSLRSFLRLVERGVAPAPVRLGRLTRWRVADLEAFAARLTAEGPEPRR